MLKMSYAAGFAALAGSTLGACFSPSGIGDDETSSGSETHVQSTGSTQTSTTIGYGSTATSQGTNPTGPIFETGGSSDSGSSEGADAGTDESEVSSSAAPSPEDTSGDSTATSDGMSQPIVCLEESAPIALDGACAPCDEAPDPDAACAERSADAPICVSGSCHSCGPDAAGICTGETPACGPELTCIPCSYHFQCPDSACHIEEGRCFSPDVVSHVDPEALCPGVGTADLPYCDFASAYATIPENGEGVMC